jgi:hypothetical protein
MLKLLIIIIILLQVSACTTTNTHYHPIVESESQKSPTLPVYYIDSLLRQYIVKFRLEAKKRNTIISKMPITMIFQETRTKSKPDVIGRCSINNGTLRVSIDTKYWNKVKSIQREELIFHELGHCILGRGHCTHKRNKKRISIMSQSVGDEKDYLENREEYLKELFNADPLCKKSIVDFT